jgi:hypothetical protein
VPALFSKNEHTDAERRKKKEKEEKRYYWADMVEDNPYFTRLQEFAQLLTYAYSTKLKPEGG